MQNAQEIYSTIRDLPSSELLRLAALILDDLAQAAEGRPDQEPRYISENVATKLAARNARTAREIEIINQNADFLSAEALDALSYQVEL
jgi:hypothetical protein